MLAALKKGDGGDGAKKPGGALLGLGGLGGLTGVGSLKAKVSNKLVATKVDEAVWRSNLTDMHRVRNMARTLWLSLEHTNEAVMRVALEIVTCRKARKILWWNDDVWASEDGKPEHLRSVIEEKFDAILQYLGKELKERPTAEAKDGPSNREVELEKQNGELEKRLKMAELQLAGTKRELEEQLQDAKDKIAQLEKSGVSRGEAGMQAELERLRALEQEQADALKKAMAEMHEYQRKNAQLEAVLQERLAELERARKEAEEAKEAVRTQMADLDGLRQQGAGAAGAQLQKEIDELRQKCDKLLAEKAALEAKLASTQAALAAKAGRSVDALPEATSAEDLSELERLRGLEAEWNSRGETCCKCGKACVHCSGGMLGDDAPLDGDLSPGGKSVKSNHELQEMLERKDAEIARLKADKKKLEQEKLDMLAMIDKLRNQINKLKEAAREAGHGDLVDRLMEESEIAQTMRSPEMSCFARLYQDAVRRMIKHAPNPRMDTPDVRMPYPTRQAVVNVTPHFYGVLEDTSPGGQSLRAQSLDYPHAGRHIERNVTLPVTLQSLEFGATGAGRGGGFQSHVQIDLEAWQTTGRGRDSPRFSPRIGQRRDSNIGGLPRGNRMVATAGSLPKSGLGLGLDWDVATTMLPAGSLPKSGPEGPPSNWRATSPKPLGPGFGGPASLRRAQGAHGLPRMDTQHGGGDALKFSRSEPQLRLKTPSSLPQLAAGKGSRTASKASKEEPFAADLPVAWKGQPGAMGRVHSRRARRAPSSPVRRNQDPEPLLMISA